MDNDGIIKGEIQNIKTTADLRNDRYFAWIRNLVTISVGFLGIFISFNSTNITDFYTRLFFISTVISTSLGILFALKVLFYEIKLLDRIRMRQEQRLIKLLADETVSPIESIGNDSNFRLFEVLCFSSFLISLISVCSYSVCTAFN